MILILLAPGAIAACDADWTCTAVFAGTQGALSATHDWGVGAAIVADSTANDVWFAVSHDIKTSGGSTYNEVTGFRYSCDDASCSTTTTLVADQTLAPYRTGSNKPNAPSLTIERESGNPRPHLLAMDDDPNCTSGTQKARLREYKYGSDWSSLLATNLLVNVTSPCDTSWNYNTILWNLVDTSFIAGWTLDATDQDVQWTARDTIGSTWPAPTAVLDATSSEHAAFAFDNAGDWRILYHDRSAVGMVFGTDTSETAIPSTAGNWGDLAFIDATTDVWRAVFGDTGAKLVESQCTVGNNCDSNSANWTATPTVIFDRTSYSVRAVDYAVASDGSEHVLWQDFNNNNVISDVWYTRRCPGGNWVGPTHVFDAATGWDEWLDVGRQHIAFTEVSGTRVVHVVLATRDSADPGSITRGHIKWARRTWTCT